MRTSLQTDVASPILLESHLEALDRRVGIILKHVNKCITKKNRPDMNFVVVDDGF